MHSQVHTEWRELKVSLRGSQGALHWLPERSFHKRGSGPNSASLWTGGKQDRFSASPSVAAIFVGLRELLGTSRTLVPVAAMGSKGHGSHPLHRLPRSSVRLLSAATKRT